MASEKSLALVLRVVEFSESSCVATLYTRDFGKIGVLAKGARRPKSPFEAALDLLAICRIVFLRKSADGLHVLTEAKLERRFRSASRDLARLYAGYYIVELLRELTDHEDPHPELFEIADGTLLAIDQGGDLASLLLRFELGALRILGHLPSFEGCVECGEPMSLSGRVAFGQLVGGLLCSRCRTGQRQVITVRAATVEGLRHLATADLTVAGLTAEPPSFDKQDRGEMRGLVNQFITHLLGHRPRMQAHLSSRIR